MDNKNYGFFKCFQIEVEFFTPYSAPVFQKLTPASYVRCDSWLNKVYQILILFNSCISIYEAGHLDAGYHMFWRWGASWCQNVVLNKNLFAAALV